MRKYPRDLVGYGRDPPDPRWPGDARICVQFVINYEEGAERSGRLHWLMDEMSTLTSPSTYEQHPENAWERLKHRARKETAELEMFHRPEKVGKR